MKTKRIELTESGVIFNEQEHTYTLNGKLLSGITAMIQRQLFPDEFEGIPQSILHAAAEYGTTVHQSIENFDKNWINDGSLEVKDYQEICTNHNLVHERSEYTITDGKDWASNVDKIFRTGDNTFTLADLKTYGEMNAEKKEKARWQLSIYAYLFELQNKKAIVDRLCIIHLRNKIKKNGETDHIADFIPVDRIPSDIVKELLDTDLRGESFQSPYAIPEEYRNQEEEIRNLIQTKAEVEDRLNAIKSRILARMEAENVKSWATSTMKLTRKLATTRSSFDLKNFQLAYPDLNYDDYMKVSNVSSSLVITI